MINTPDKSVAQSSRSPSIGEDEKKASEDDKKGITTEEITTMQSLPRNTAHLTEEDELNPAALKRAFRFAAWSSVILVSSPYHLPNWAMLTLVKLVVMLLIIPLPLFFASTIFGERGFAAWVVIGIIWTFMSAITVVLYPLWESREALMMICKGIVKVRYTEQEENAY